MSILITGATGFLGRALTKELLARDVKRICVYSRGEYAQAQMRQELKDDSRLRWFIGDVRDEARLIRAMQGVEHVIHAAALKRIEVGESNPDELVKTNVMGSMNVIEAASRAGVKKCLLISSDKAYQPISPYGQSKALAESLFLRANTSFSGATKYAACRYGNIWCSTGSIVPKWRDILASGSDKVPVTDPAATRFFMRIGEAVKLVLGTLDVMNGGEVAIPKLPAYQVGDLAQAMGARMMIIGLPKFEKLHESMNDEQCSLNAKRMSIAEIAEELNGRAS